MHLEEKALDEAEMPGDLFEKKWVLQALIELLSPPFNLPSYALIQITAILRMLIQIDSKVVGCDLVGCRYESIYAMKKAMESKWAEHKEELDALPPQERDKVSRLSPSASAASFLNLQCAAPVQKPIAHSLTATKQKNTCCL